MTYRFNAPPGWPPVPPGWVPPRGWVPPPSWPPAPAGWQFWLQDAPAPRTPSPAPAASSGQALAASAGRVLGRVYLGPSRTRPARKAVRGALLGLLTLGLVTAPFQNEPSEVTSFSSPAPGVEAAEPTSAAPTSSSTGPAPTTAAATTTAATSAPPATTAARVSPAAIRPLVGDVAARQATTRAAQRPTTKKATRKAPKPTTKKKAAAKQKGSCDPSYPGVCIPPITVRGDLDCPDIPYRRFAVLPPDPHGFDRDNDGGGCES
ncbi:MAG: hypothetical protein U0Q15_19460 [Kineosporiaceae bacterium]